MNILSIILYGLLVLVPAPTCSNVPKRPLSLNSDRRLYQDEIEELVGEMTSYISNNLEHSLRAGNSSILKFVFHPDSWELEPEHKDDVIQPETVIMDSVSSLLVYVPSTASTTTITTTTSTTTTTISTLELHSQVPKVTIKEWSQSSSAGSIGIPFKTNRETAIPSGASLIREMDPMEHLQDQSDYIQQLSMQNTYDSDFWVNQGLSESAIQVRPQIPTSVPQRTQVPFLGTPFQRFDSTWSPYKTTASHRVYKPTAPAMLLESPPGHLKKPLQTSDVLHLPNYHHPLRPTYSPNITPKAILAPLLTVQSIKGYRPTVQSSQFDTNPQGFSSSKYKPTIKPFEDSATIKSETMAQATTALADLGGSVPKYKPTNRPEPLLTTSGFFLLTASSTQSDLPMNNVEKVTSKTTKPTTTTTTRSTSSTTTTTTSIETPTTERISELNGISTIKPNQVVEVNLYDLVEHFVLGFDKFLRQVLNGGLGKTVNSLTAALRETFSGRNSIVNLLIVFGIPTATAGLTFMGVGPMAVAVAAWMVPILSVVVIPDLVANDNVERTRSLLT